MKQEEIIKEREILKSWLKHGDISSIATTCNVHRDVVYNWFNGSDNRMIETVVKRIVELRKEQAMDAAEKIANQ